MDHNNRDMIQNESIKTIIGASLNKGAKEEYIVRRQPFDKVCAIK